MIYKIKPYQEGHGAPALNNYRQITPWNFVRDNNTTLTITGGYIDTEAKVLVRTITKWVMSNTSTRTRFSSKGGSSIVDMFYVSLPTGALDKCSPEYVNEYLCSLGPVTSMFEQDPTFYGNYEYGFTIHATTSFQPRFFFDLSYEIDTVTKVNNWLTSMYNNGTPLEFTFFLKEPETYSLTDSEITRFLYQIGVQTHFVNGASLLNTLMYNAQGREYKDLPVIPPVMLAKRPIENDNLIKEDITNAFE